MSDSNLVQLVVDNSVALVTINKPQALNALSSEVLAELKSVVEKIQSDAQIRCVLVTGAGEKAFVAGADIKQIHDLDVDSAKEFAELGQSVFSSLEDLPVPVIAVVNGFALGGGLELAMACDFILASEKAKFGLPECTLGLMPGFGGSVRLARKVGPALAKQMMFTGDMISAEDAKAAGLVNQVFAPDELIDGAQAVAKTISMRAPLALAAIKRTVESTYGVARDTAMVHEQDQFAGLFSSSDCKEGTAAFIEKRKPQFTGN